MQQQEIGTLVVVVLKAQHLHQPSFYKQDPYAQASLSGLKKRTKVASKGGQHPVWDDELRFPILADVGKDKANRILEIACFKDEQRGEDVLLGKGTVDIEETLRTGEFDDWVSLETSAGTRGEVYLEMTFYANSSPPLTRRPSKLSPSDRLARPAQGQQPIAKTPPVTSAHPGRSPVTTERKTTQPIGSQIPASLIPAHGLRSQVSRQAPPNGGTSPAVITKKDSLPPLPVDDTFAVGSGKNPGLPAALHPGGRAGPRPMPQQSQSRVTSMGRPPPEIIPEPLHRRTLSDTPLHTPSPYPPLQTSAQSYSSESTFATGVGIGSTPSILVEEHLSPVGFPIPHTSPPGPIHPSVQPAFVPAPTQDYVRTLPPSQPSNPLQSPYTPLGQAQQRYDVSPPSTPLPSYYQQYTQYPTRPVMSQSLPPPQMHPQQQSFPPYLLQQPPYSPQPQPPYQQPGLPSQQHQYLPQQQQYHLQHPPHTQTPHPPPVLQPYQPSVTPQQPLYTQTSPIPAPPPLPPIQSQTPQPPQSYFTPPPPPPPLHNQGGKTLVPPTVTQPPQTPIPSQGPISTRTPLQQSVVPVAPLLHPPPLPPRGSSDTVTATSTEIFAQSQAEDGRNVAKPVASAETTTVVQETRETLVDVRANQTTETQDKGVFAEESRQPDALQDVGAHEERGPVQCMEERHDEELQRAEETKRQEERTRQQEEERRRRESEEREEEARKEEERRQKELRVEEECRKREEEHRMQEEEQRRRREEEEQRRKEEEQRKKEEEQRRKEEECGRREEEERRKREEERRRREEEERRRQEERRKREEEEHRRREERRQEEERKRQEEEHRRQEEERLRRKREEAERRQKEAETRKRRAEEAEAERKWQQELARIKARAEQEAADAAFARAQMEAEEEERRRQEEEDLALVRQAQEEEEREQRLARDRRQQEEADREVARREQAHEEELERKREEERRKRMEEADRELARRLDMELNLNT